MKRIDFVARMIARYGYYVDIENAEQVSILNFPSLMTIEDTRTTLAGIDRYLLGRGAVSRGVRRIKIDSRQDGNNKLAIGETKECLDGDVSDVMEIAREYLRLTRKMDLLSDINSSLASELDSSVIATENKSSKSDDAKVILEQLFTCNEIEFSPMANKISQILKGSNDSFDVVEGLFNLCNIYAKAYAQSIAVIDNQTEEDVVGEDKGLVPEDEGIVIPINSSNLQRYADQNDGILMSDPSRIMGR